MKRYKQVKATLKVHKGTNFQKVQKVQSNKNMLKTPPSTQTFETNKKYTQLQNKKTSSSTRRNTNKYYQQLKSQKYQTAQTSN